MQSLVSYTTRNLEKKKQEMAAILDHCKPSFSLVPFPCPPTERDKIDDFIATCDLEKICAEEQSSRCVTSTLASNTLTKEMRAINFAGASFGDNCTIHLHL